MIYNEHNSEPVGCWENMGENYPRCHAYTYDEYLSEHHKDFSEFRRFVYYREYIPTVREEKKKKRVEEAKLSPLKIKFPCQVHV